MIILQHFSHMLAARAKMVALTEHARTLDTLPNAILRGPRFLGHHPRTSSSEAHFFRPFRSLRLLVVFSICSFAPASFAALSNVFAHLPSCQPPCQSAHT